MFADDIKKSISFFSAQTRVRKRHFPSAIFSRGISYSNAAAEIFLEEVAS